MSNVFNRSLSGGTSNKHFYTDCLGGCHKPEAVIHNSDSGSTGQLLMCFVTFLVTIFIKKLQMEIPCQKQALPLVHHNILAQSSLCQAVMAKCFLTHALHDSPFVSLRLTSFENIHISSCGSHDGQLIAIGPEP